MLPEDSFWVARAVLDTVAAPVYPTLQGMALVGWAENRSADVSSGGERGGERGCLAESRSSDSEHTREDSMKWRRLIGNTTVLRRWAGSIAVLAAVAGGTAWAAPKEADSAQKAGVSPKARS